MFLCNVFVGLCLLLFIQGGYGQITCYQCNSYTDRNKTACLDPMNPDNVYTRICGNNFACTKVSYYTQNTFVTSRSCDQITSDTCNDIKNTMKDMYHDLSGYQCTACQKNFCNRGFVMMGSMVAVVSTLFLVLPF